MKKGEVTAFLSLIFILVMAAAASVIESASVQTTKNRRRGDMDRAIESVFAEYRREMLEEYDIFTLEGTYESGHFAEENVTGRLEFYGVRDAVINIEKIQFLTDDFGQAYREQVIAYMKHKLGISGIEEFAGASGKWKEQEDKAEQYSREETDVTEELESGLKEGEQEFPEDDNPIAVVSNIRKTGLLNVVVKNQDEISNKSVAVAQMPSHRSLRKGTGGFKIREDAIDEISNLYFISYLLEKFKGADEPAAEGSLSYELEYILNGAGSDRENLEAAVRQLAALRFVPNYGYLMTDEMKKAEAETTALALAGIVALPALAAVIKHAILLSWAFGESLMDIRTLLSGGKVPLVKNAEGWRLTLAGLMKLGTAEDKTDGPNAKGGLSYRDYLRILLFLKSKKECTMRSLDVIEMQMQRKAGEFFRVDNCISKLEVKSRCSLRRNIDYEFKTNYGYQ